MWREGEEEGVHGRTKDGSRVGEAGLGAYEFGRIWSLADFWLL